MQVYLNGSWLDESEAHIAINDRGFLFADGVFETARLHRARYFRLRHHLERLQASARLLELAAPPLSELGDVALELARRNQLDDGSLRITLTRGPGGSGLDPAGTGPPTVLVTLSPVAPDWRERAARGWTLVTSRTRRPSPDSVPAQLKALGRAYAILAQLEARRAGADDALLLTAEAAIGEGPTWNFFWRKARLIRTAALEGGILEGVTRSIILELVRAEGYQVEEGLWPRADLDSADEAFATMTSKGVVPIRMLDGRAFPSTDCATLMQGRYWKFVDAELDG